MLKKKEIRQWLRNFFVMPQKKFEQKIWLWDKGIMGGMTMLLALTTKENFPLVVLIGAVILIAIYEFIAKGR